MKHKCFTRNVKGFGLLAVIFVVLCGIFWAMRGSVQPQDTIHPSGWSEEGLYINLNGTTYLYPEQSPGIGSLTPGKLLDVFTVQTSMEGIVWEIYAAKEYPNLTKVLAISGTNSSWTCYIP